MKNTKDYSNQTGSVRQKGKHWYYRFRMKDADGNWKMHEFKGGKNKRETEAMLREALADYNTIGYIYEPGSITVNELAKQWYESEIEHTSLTTNGRNGYKNVLRHIREHKLGSMKLRDVTCEALQSYVDEKYFGIFDKSGKQIKPGYSESHMRKQFVVLNGIFKYAVYPKRLLRENLMQYIKKRKKPQKETLFDDDIENKLHTITHEEYNQIIQKLSENGKNAVLILPVQIAYFTGLRAGEVCGLTWEDINFQEQYLIVRRSMYYDNETKCWELKVPKNGKSRIVDFGDQLAQILRKAKKTQLEEKMRYGALYQHQYYQNLTISGRFHYQIFTDLPEDTKTLSSRATKGKFVGEHDINQPLTELHFVCSKIGGELLTTQTLKWCNKVVKQLLPELQHFHFHGLRHTYASTLIAHGANFKDVQELLGHSDIKITLNTYSHLSQHTRKKAVSIFESAVSE